MAQFIDGGLLPEDDPIFSGSWMIHTAPKLDQRLTPDMRRAMESVLTDDLKEVPEPPGEQEP
jgi:hypothetical protein